VSTGRNTTTRDQHRAAIRRTKPPCGICHGDIDYTLKSPDPKSYVVDHITPLNRGGTDTLDNKQAAHRDCNRTKSDKTEADNSPRTFITTRTWTPGGPTPRPTPPPLVA
jgi:5-methylcytosine-specific restriction endonuclease McrA